jgi:hypothetical protein
MLIGISLSLLGLASFIFLTSDNHDNFAKCLNEKGLKLYGAFWCPHCQEQKQIFGTSQKYLNYVECSTPDGKSQSEICANNNVTSYPTWELSNGTRLVGEQSFEELSLVSECIVK